MNGQAHWSTGLVLLCGALAVLFLPALAAWLVGSFRRVPRRLVCPVSGQKVDTILMRNEKTGHFTSVVECSAFEDPTKVTCDHECARQQNGERSVVQRA